MSFENVFSRASVAFDSSRKVGKMNIASASDSLRDASAPKKSLALTISSRSWPRRSFTAFSARPELRTRRRSEGSWESSISSTSSPVATNRGRLPIASLRSSPRPLSIAVASSRIQPWKFLRVSLSKSEMISSISTASVTAVAGSRSPSSRIGPDPVPGVSST